MFGQLTYTVCTLSYCNYYYIESELGLNCSRVEWLCVEHLSVE
jgi:hypothetical protein